MTHRFICSLDHPAKLQTFLKRSTVSLLFHPLVLKLICLYLFTSKATANSADPQLSFMCYAGYLQTSSLPGFSVTLMIPIYFVDRAGREILDDIPILLKALNISIILRIKCKFIFLLTVFF